MAQLLELQLQTITNESATNQETTLPSSPNSGIESNLQLRLPVKMKYPVTFSSIPVMIGIPKHGGISLGNGWFEHTRPDKAGVIEAGLSPYSKIGEASQVRHKRQQFFISTLSVFFTTH